MITNVVEGDIVQLKELDGHHFGVHFTTIYTPMCNKCSLSYGYLIQWPVNKLVYLNGGTMNVTLKEVLKEMDSNLWYALEETLPQMEYLISFDDTSCNTTNILVKRSYTLCKCTRRNTTISNESLLISNEDEEELQFITRLKK